MTPLEDTLQSEPETRLRYFKKDNTIYNLKYFTVSSIPQNAKDCRGEKTTVDGYLSYFLKHFTKKKKKFPIVMGKFKFVKHSHVRF